MQTRELCSIPVLPTEGLLQHRFRFSSAQQLQIIMEVLEAKEAFGGCGLSDTSTPRSDPVI